MTHGDDHFQVDGLDLGGQIIQLGLGFGLDDGLVEVKEGVGSVGDLLDDGLDHGPGLVRTGGRSGGRSRSGRRSLGLGCRLGGGSATSHHNGDRSNQGCQVIEFLHGSPQAELASRAQKQKTACIESLPPRLSRTLCHINQEGQPASPVRVRMATGRDEAVALTPHDRPSKMADCHARAYPPLHDPIRQGNPAHQPRRGDAPQLPRLRHERDRGPGPARRPGRPQTGAPARVVRHARAQQRLEPRLQEVRAYRR